MVVSLDIAGLFTIVPFDKSIELTVNLVHQDDDREPNFTGSTFESFYKW